MQNDRDKHIDLRRLPLVELVSIIVREGNRSALCEFHDRRTVFTFRQREGLRFAEYVACLRESACSRGDDAVSDTAYSLTVDKFNRLPDGENRSGMQRKDTGTDCRNYFRPFLAAMENGGNAMSAFSPLEMDYAAARVLQGLVSRHFQLSLMEARRRVSPGMSRYMWKLPNGRLTVMMSAQIEGRRRKAWLEQNVEDPDPCRLGERERVQAIINEKLGGQTYSYRDEVDCGPETVAAHAPPPCLNDPDMIYELAEAVADEKADSIEEQRTTIRNMRPAALRNKIHQIFALLAEEELADGDIAGQVGMDKVTYSRFAGTRWGARTSIPDLWANTAHVLASNPDFVGAARRGVRARVEEIIRVTGGKRGGGTDHD